MKLIKTRINGKWDIYLPKHRAERPEWFTHEGWEKKRLEHMFSTTELGDKVFYIGAEEGEMCALLEMWGADVLMFEPNEKVWPNIKAIWEANKLGGFSMFKGFAGNQTTHDILFHTDASIEGEVIHDHGFKELKDPGDIPIVKIDDVVITHGPPSMITMDAEGSEWEVLKGAEDTIDKYHPRIYLSLHPEFLFDQYGKYSREVRDWLIGKGYTETLLDYQHEVHLFYEYKDD